MANDRVFLVCKTCHKATLLYKFYPGVPFMYRDALPGLDKFIEQHVVGCHPRGLEGNLGGDPGFFLITEDDYDRNFGGYVKKKKELLRTIFELCRVRLGGWQKT